MQITSNIYKIIPFLLMVIFALRESIDFNVIDLSMASYAILALMLTGGLFLFYKIVRDQTIAQSDLIFFSFIVIVILSTFIHGTDVKAWIYYSISILFLRLAFYFYNNQIKYLILGLAFGFNIGLFAQLHQLITQPQMWLVPDTEKEIAEYIFGGNYNQMGIRILITLVANFLCLKISKAFYFLLIPSVIVGISVSIMVGSMTAVTCIILFILLCLIPSAYLRRTSVKVLLLFVALFQLFVCFSGKGIENSEFAVWFVEDVLGKDVTFTNRTHMWDSALRVIADSPLIGYGFPDKDWYLAHMTSFAIGPHNILLATLIYGGVIAFGIYLYVLIRSLFCAASVHDFHGDCLFAAISTSCLMMLMEAYPMAIIFCLFTLAEYYPQFNAQLSLQNES